MKNIILTLVAFLGGFAIIQAQTTFELRLTEAVNDGTNYSVRLEMQMHGDDPTVFKLGSTALQFAFPKEALTNPVVESTTLEASFPYLQPTVTTPKPGQCSFNIELAVPNTGVEIASNGWTELGTVSFTILNNDAITPLSWSYNGGTTETVVFLDDEATQIFIGELESQVGISESTLGSVSNELSVYPNPCNGEEINFEMNNLVVDQFFEIEVIDVYGKKVYFDQLKSTTNVFQKEVQFESELADGVYFINLYQNSNIITKKFVVE